MKKNLYDKFYKKVPQDQIERLKRFRSTHEYKYLTVNGATWEYISCGQGKEVLLILAGGTGIGEAFSLLFTTLENEYRIVSPSYPAVTTIEQMVDGIVKILEVEGISLVNIIGQSGGGIFGQVIVRKYPDKVNKLVLSHTLTTSPPVDKAIMLEREKRNEKALKMLPFFPMGMFHLLIRRKISKMLSTVSTEEKEFWKAYFYEMLSYMTKDYFSSNLKCGFDFYRNYIFSKDDLANWSGKILILESDNDQAIVPSEREALKELYPQAQVHTFQGTGHLTLLLKPEEFISMVRNFIKQEK